LFCYALGRESFSRSLTVLTQLLQIPSTLMEHFFLDYRVLSRFAQSQGQTLPQGLLEEFLAQESQWKGINTQFEVRMAPRGCVGIVLLAHDVCVYFGR